MTKNTLKLAICCVLGAAMLSACTMSKYSKKDGSFVWHTSSYAERVFEYSINSTNPKQKFNFKIQSAWDVPNSKDKNKLYGYYYPKIFKDPSKIKSLIVDAESLEQTNIPFGITFKKTMEDGKSAADFIAPDGKVIGTTSAIPSVQDFVFQPELTDKCGVLTTEIENVDSKTGAPIKPLKCSKSGQRYNFSDFDWSQPAHYDLTKYVKQGLIPYVFYIQQGDEKPAKLSVKFKIEYND